MPRRSTRKTKIRSNAASATDKLSSAEKTSASSFRSEASDVDDSTLNPASSSSSESEAEASATVVSSRGCRSRPPLAKKKDITNTNRSSSNNKRKKRPVESENEKEDDDRSDENLSPLKKKQLLQTTDAPTETSGRPRRRAAATKKKQYAEVDSASEEENSDDGIINDNDSYEDFDGGNKETRAIGRKTQAKSAGGRPPRAARNKRTKQKPSKKQTTPSPSVSKRPAPSKSKKGAPATVISTPSTNRKIDGIGLTPIQDSIRKVWKSEGDWRDQGAIDYDCF